MQNKIEILAPAGSEESFLAAVSAGANAVYLGLKDFSARAKAKNFSFSQLNQICNYAKQNNIKVFVAFNTLFQQEDINKVFKCLNQLSSTSVNGLIVQDLSLAYIVKKYFPDLNLHASTQLCIHNSYGIKQAEKFGFKRAVLARELSLEQIKQIKKHSNIELEIFCHGALCFCVSGLCLFSSFIGGYSGNRGLCTQPCRRLWNINNKQGYFFSPKDLQLAQYVQQLKETGITSLKIEGRMKTADYVYKTVKAYRLLADATSDNFNETLLQAQEILKYDYARTKTTCNFINKSEEIFEPEKSKNLGLYLGKVENKTSEYFNLKNIKEVYVGDTLRIVDLKKDKSQVLKVAKIEGDKIFYENLYLENNFEVYKIADGTRSEDWKNKNLEELKKFFVEQKFAETNNNKLINLSTVKPFNNVPLPNLFIRINNFKWLPLLKNKKDIVLKLNKTNIINIKSLKDIKDYYIELPSYIDEQDLILFQQTIDFIINKGCNKFFVNNISHFEFFKNKKTNLFAGQFLYTLNLYCAQFLSLQNIKAYTVSWEDDIYNIRNLSKSFLKNNLIVYLSGFPEIVTSKMKFLDEVKNKNVKSGKDEFKVISTDYENVLVPRFPVNILSFKNNLVSMGIKSFGIDLSYIEPNNNYLTQMLNAFNNNLYINSANKFNFERKLK